MQRTDEKSIKSRQVKLTVAMTWSKTIMTARHRHGEIIKFGHTAFGSGAIIHRLKECSLRLTREKCTNADDVLLPRY